MEDTKTYLNKIKKKFSIEQIKSVLNQFKDLNVVVIGDTILDLYVFTTIKGRAIKDPILSVEYKYEEMYGGGVLAVANHISNFVKKIKLVTLIGDKNPYLDFVEKSLRDNIDLKTFVKENSYTTIKKRYLKDYRYNKLFKIEYMNDKPISESLSKEIVSYLSKEIPKYDMVIVADFGHGFINKDIKEVLSKKSRFLALNAQSNSANMGYNYFNLYNKMDFISMSDEELRLPLSMRFEEIEKVIEKGRSFYGLNKFVVTLGNKGCIYVNKDKIFKAPIVTSSVKDTVGAGDALYAIAALCAYANIDNELVPFLANCVGGLGANIIGNKENITQEMLLNFAKDVLK